ncbi:hypothetical protein OG884_08875 [Streptosporangium sp. NBC_01755]|uniref:hypothetical protein n=1 Tax=unclassified Streptosporangium TaxID=2632669 RepID=UPI002DDB87AF|nr:MULTISPECIES: hypothetical protein [unclassified Streptosporangium]WSA26565.1 hypothetical protein OIE13_01285 [Streptosporangium sp. NBC_01810]WSD02012.1 hypothetical protein OG884_08875 [Streptosporangium sp. NBC_01755]
MITEPQTGFLGSGWTSESKTSVTWPEDEERSGGRIKTTLLIVAAVAVVLGGTVFGIRALTGSEGSAADCPPTGCVTAASNQPELQPDPVGETEPEEPVPTDEPAEAGDRTAEATPSPTPTSTRRGGGATPTSRPTATRKATRAPLATDEPSSTDKPEPTPTSEPLVVGDHRTPAPEQSPSTTAPAPVPSDTFEPPVPAAGGAMIMVGAALVRSRAQSYTVKLVVAADESVENLKVSVPVSGTVSSASGADWEQVGDSLVIESPEGLQVGEELVVVFTASGDAEIPETCESDGGECAVA